MPIKRRFQGRSVSNIKENMIKTQIGKNIFHEYDSNSLFDWNIEEFHNMTKDHTEILGQFLDFTAMSIEELKECLLSGYIHMDRAKFISRWMKHFNWKEGEFVKSIEDRLKEFIEYIDKVIEAEYDKFPLSPEDAIRKNSYCLALQRDQNAIMNILNGHDFNYVEE